MKAVAAVFLAIIFLSISILHVYWVCGGKWGLSAAMPNTMKDQVAMVSNRLWFKVATSLVALGLFLFMYLFLVQAGLVASPISAQYLRYTTYAVCGIFLLRAIGDFKYCGFFKRIKDGDFARNDSKYYSPLCLFISVLTLIILA